MMKIRAALFLTAIAGLQLTVAQDVTDCTDIAAGLNTMPIDPITGKATICTYEIVTPTVPVNYYYSA